MFVGAFQFGGLGTNLARDCLEFSLSHNGHFCVLVAMLLSSLFRLPQVACRVTASGIGNHLLLSFFSLVQISLLSVVFFVGPPPT